MLQPRRGYRAATDPVFLAAAVPAQPGHAVLDLGCGAGAALLCLGARVPGLRIAGLELQPAYAALARRNAALNGLDADIFVGDIAAPPPALRERSFDHVLTNPPFFAAGTGTASSDSGRARAHGEGSADLAAFLDLGLRRLKPGGSLTVIHRTERLGDMLAALAGRAGDVRILPLAPRAGRRPPASARVRPAGPGPWRRFGRRPWRIRKPQAAHQLMPSQPIGPGRRLRPVHRSGRFRRRRRPEWAMSSPPEAGRSWTGHPSVRGSVAARFLPAARRYRGPPQAAFAQLDPWYGNRSAPRRPRQAPCPRLHRPQQPALRRRRARTRTLPRPPRLPLRSARSRRHRCYARCPRTRRLR